MTERRELDPYGYALELAERRREWEQRRKAEAEERDRREKQARLEAYLKRRSEAYLDHTGEQPGLADLATWRREYMDQKEAEYQRERQEKIDRAIRENYDY